MDCSTNKDACMLSDLTW